MNVNEQIKQIAERIKYLREAIDVPAQDIAEKAGISEDEYLSYENGEKDIPVSIIYEVSSALGVDPTEIITGEAPHRKKTRRSYRIPVRNSIMYSRER